MLPNKMIKVDLQNYLGNTPVDIILPIFPFQNIQFSPHVYFIEVDFATLNFVLPLFVEKGNPF